MESRDIIYVIIFAIAAFILFPIIGRLVLFLLFAAAIFFTVMYFKSRSLKKEIEKDPAEYFAQQMNQRREKEPVSSEVIDVEYKEKEIESE